MMDHLRVSNGSRISENTARLMTAVREALAQYESPKSEKPVPNPNFIKLDDALKSKRFSYYRMGLYKEADTDEEIGKIWHLKEYENPKTGEKEKWLVVYTDDNDELIRQLASKKLGEIKKTAAYTKGSVDVIVSKTPDGKTIAKEVDPKGNPFGSFSQGSYWQFGRVGDFIKPNHMICDGCGRRLSPDEMGWQYYGNGKAFDYQRGECCVRTNTNPRGESNQTPGAMDRLTSKTADMQKDAAPQKAPNPKDVPLAPGVRSKNLTIDESGAAGTAKVTVEFTDVDEGLKFYQEQPEGAGGGKGEVKPEEGEAEEGGSEEEVPEVEGKGQGQENPQGKVVPSKTPGVPPVPPATPQGMIQPAQGSTVHKMTHFGQQAITVIKSVVAGSHKGIVRTVGEGSKSGDRSTGNLPHQKPKNWDRLKKTKTWPKMQDKDPQGGVEDNRVEDYKDIKPEGSYHFINEDGKIVPLIWQEELRVGSQFERPDTGGMARVAGYVIEKFASNDFLVDQLIATAEKKPYRCDTCDTGFTEGQMNFHKNHDHRKNTEDKEEPEEEKKEPAEEKKEPKEEKKEAEKEEGTEKESALQVDAEKCPKGIPADVKKKVKKEYGEKNPKTYQTLWKIKKNKEKKKSDLSLEFVREAADISDEIPPMGWQNDETGKKPAGAGPALPPNQDLQTGNPTQPKPNVLYDSKQDSGPQFQTTIDPKDKSVKIKFIDSGAEEALQSAVQAPQAPLPNPAQPPPQPPPAGGPQQGPPGMGGGNQQGRGEFSQQEVPTEF